MKTIFEAAVDFAKRVDDSVVTTTSAYIPIENAEYVTIDLMHVFWANSQNVAKIQHNGRVIVIDQQQIQAILMNGMFKTLEIYKLGDGVEFVFTDVPPNHLI